MNVDFIIVLVIALKLVHFFHIKILFLRKCVLLSYINFLVNDVHQSKLGPLQVPNKRESLSMLEGVSELVKFGLFLLILWL